MVMTDKISERGNALENAYFAKKERELLEAIAKAQADGLDGLEQLGDVERTLLRKWSITVSQLPTLHIVPLVRVAWADGTVQSGERDLIEKALLARGIAADSEGWSFIQGLLDQRPSHGFFEDLTTVLVSQTGGADEEASSLVELARAVALASGGFLGFGKLDHTEAAVIDQLAAALAEAHPEAAAEAAGTD